MDVKIVEEKEIPFFKRKDLRVEVSHESAPTPSKAELTKELATKYNVDDSQVIIDYMFTTKGVSKTIAKIKILKEKPEAEKKEKEEAKENEAQTSETE